MRITVASDQGFASIFDRMDGPLSSSDPSVQAQNDAPHVVAALRALGHDVVHAVLGVSIHPELQAIADAAPDLVVNLCDSLMGDPELAAIVPAFFAARRLRHTGGDAKATALGKRKHDVKAVLVREGLPTPRYQVIDVDDDVSRFSLELAPPVILKLCGEQPAWGSIRDRCASTSTPSAPGPARCSGAITSRSSSRNSSPAASSTSPASAGPCSRCR